MEMHLSWQKMGGVLLSEGNIKSRQHSSAGFTICFICFQNGDDVSLFSGEQLRLSGG